MFRVRTRAVTLCIVLTAHAAAADDAYLRIPLRELTITEGVWPEHDPELSPEWEVVLSLRPYAVLDGPGEVFVGSESPEDENEWTAWWWQQGERPGVLVARIPEGEALTGVLFVPDAAWSGLTPLRFSATPPASASDAWRAFHASRRAHYERLQRSGVPGAAWFRRRASESRRALAEDPDDRAQPEWRAQVGREFSDTYALFTGGRAVSENLQLDREAPPDRPPEPGQPAASEEPVPVGSIEGVTVRSIDWAPLLGEEPPVLDPLASAIPEDQHAVFFPSFDALLAVADETTSAGLPIFRAVGPRSEDGRILERYERQLGLSRGVVARLLGPRAVRSVAITGSDPYFPTGTDVAILFEAVDADALRTLVLAQVGLAVGAVPGATPESGDVEGVRYEGITTPDRSVCSYVANFGPAVVVTNSLAQLRRLAAVQTGKTLAVASLPEYQYFRTRYPRGADAGRAGAEGETGFAFISDAAIRRWCGPEWRIGASRRLRAAAIMADATAAHLHELVAAEGKGAPHDIESETPMRTLGRLTLEPVGVRSSVYGSTAFITPIIELDIDEVAPDEAAAYRRWRDTYQRNWSWAFDPIAVTFTVGAERLSADLTVVPLIASTDYRFWIDAARGASIAPDGGDLHDAMLHAVAAININSPAVKQANGMARAFVPGVEIDPLGWLGQSVAVYADPDPFWEQLRDADNHQEFIEEHAEGFPVALRAEVSSALKLTAFLAAARGFIDQSAPGMTAWETRTHNDQAYVRVGLSEMARAQGQGGAMERVALYYAATPRALIVSLHEGVLQRALDRQAVRAEGAGAPPPGTPAWLGSSLCLRATKDGLRLVEGMDRHGVRRRAWGNIAILNEWKRLFPDRDPVQVHEAFWGTRLVCPAGGSYAWNERFRTMESTLYGHPGVPTDGPEGFTVAGWVNGVDLGVTFEEQGLRARGVLERGKGR